MVVAMGSSSGRLEFLSDPDAQSLLTGQPGGGPEEQSRSLSELLG